MDGIFGIGPLELILIAVIALIVLGPERLPGVMREGARYIREIRKLGSELTSQFSDELKVLDEMNPRRLINEALDPSRPDANKPAEAAKAAPATPADKPLAPKPASSEATTPAPAPVSSAAVITRAAGGAPPPKAAITSKAAQPSENGAGAHGGDQIIVADEPAHTILPPVDAPAAPSSPPSPPPEQPA